MVFTETTCQLETKNKFLYFSSSLKPKQTIKNPTESSTVELAPGANNVRYEFVDKYFDSKISCEWTVQAIVHQCKPFSLSKYGSNFRVSKCTCEEELKNCETEIQPLGTQVALACKDQGKLIQPMIGKEKIQDKYPNLMKGMMAVVSTGDAKKSFDSVDLQESNVFPAQEIIFRFES